MVATTFNYFNSFLQKWLKSEGIEGRKLKELKELATMIYILVYVGVWYSHWDE